MMEMIDDNDDSLIKMIELMIKMMLIKIMLIKMIITKDNAKTSYPF